MKKENKQAIENTLIFFSGFTLICTIIGIPLGLWLISKIDI